jgi:hypothetical protein
MCPVEQQSYILYVWMSIIPLLILGICVLIYFNFRYEIQLLIRKNKAHVPNDKFSSSAFHIYNLSKLYSQAKFCKDSLIEWNDGGL